MLKSTKEVQGYSIRAIDGDIGHLHEFYFDDLTWIVRYFVVDTGNWLPGRKVLLWPGVVGQPNWQIRTLPVDLLKEQVESSPDINTDEPVNREYEVRLYDYYGRPQYWA